MKADAEGVGLMALELRRIGALAVTVMLLLAIHFELAGSAPAAEALLAGGGVIAAILVLTRDMRSRAGKPRGRLDA